MKTIGKNGCVNLMTSPVLASRLPVFYPSLKKGKTDWHVKNVYGEVKVSGNLTQIHRNLLDAIFAFSIKTREFENGSMELLVDPFQITSITKSDRHHEWLLEKLYEMKMANVELTDAKGLRHWGGIVSEWREANISKSLPGGAMTGERKFYAITISSVWMRLYKTSLTVNYKEFIGEISSLKSGVLQAIARHCLTHQELNKKLDELLMELGAINETTSRTRKYEISKEVRDADLSKFGITIKNDVVFYKKQESVKFLNGSQD